MKRFGSEPNHNLLRCVQIAKLIESDSGIRRAKIEHILQTGPSPTNEIALTLLQHLGWIQRQNKAYIWGEISNEDSKLLWLSDEINQDELSNVNLQFAYICDRFCILKYVQCFGKMYVYAFKF